MNLYEKILEATKNLDGWATPEKQITLANLVLAIRPHIIVEIGVWGGKSLVPMVMAAKEIELMCSVHAIDPWAASESIQGQTGENKSWWGRQEIHDMVYSRFLDTLKRLELQVIVHRKSSNDVEFHPIAKIDLIHIDGNHGPQALLDVKKFCPRIPTGGICVLDDLDWTGGSVKQAAQWLKDNGFLELHPLGTGAVYQRIK